MTKSEDLTRTGHDDQWHAAILGDVRGAHILGMGPDVWEVGHRLASRVGSSGRYTGVYVDAETIRAARQRNGANGGARVEFHEIDGDLQLSRAAADAVVARQAPATLDDFVAVQHELERLRIDQPLVKNQSIDLVFSTGLRHLESHAARTRMLREFHRVIKRGGRLVVLDVVSDEDASDEVLRKAGPVDGDTIGSTVARDADLLGALADVGFYGVTLVRRDDTPWTIVDGIEFRRVAVVAYRG
jgi:SAM-dependent methyltransferase